MLAPLTAAAIGAVSLVPVLAGAAPIVPAWDWAFPHQTQFCFEAPGPVAPTPQGDRRETRSNHRLVWLALPEGTPPAAGWPVWVSLVTDSFSADPQYGNATGVVCDEGRHAPGGRGWSPDKKFWPFSLPAFANISVTHGWNYDQEAGAMWNQRLKQHMLANGVAVLCVNPISIDSWDAGPWYWPQGVDRPYLSALFKHLKTGARGPLDLNRMTVRGYVELYCTTTTTTTHSPA
jgi:hypothetical protein